MKALHPSAPLLCLLPGLALVPVAVVTLQGLHGGGLEIWWRCLQGALQPSLDPVLIRSLWNGLQVTLATALAGWGLSTLAGVGLGCLSSDVVWMAGRLPRWPAMVLRRGLALPRSIHELLWGLVLLQILGLHPLVAVAAIAIPYTALVARVCLLYTSPSPRDYAASRMPSSA